jgi:hypothetical protein
VARKRQAKRCTAHRTNGQPCKGWAVHGTNVCSAHGGRAPQVKAAAAERLAVEQAAVRFGLDLDATPADEIMLREIRRSSAMVQHLAGLVNALTPDELAWGIAGRDIRQPRQPGGQPDVQVHQAARVHPFVKMLDQERRTLREWLETAHRCGIEERRMRMAERDGRLIASMLEGVMAEFMRRWTLSAVEVTWARSVIAGQLRTLASGISS